MKTIQIHGKDYITVAERIKHFRDNFKDGCIKTEIVSDMSANRVVIKATAILKDGRMFTGHSQAEYGKGQMGGVALENAETSAVGRCLGLMGIGVIDDVASGNEMKKIPKGNEFSKAQNLIETSTNIDGLIGWQTKLKENKKFTIVQKNQLSKMIDEKIKELRK